MPKIKNKNEKSKLNLKKLKKIIKNVSFDKNAIDIGYKFQVKKMKEDFLIRTSFKRPDTNTGKIGTGYGRWMFVDQNSDDRAVVMTMFICVKLIVEHEILESLKYKNARILDPHKSLKDLAYPQKFKQKWNC